MPDEMSEFARRLRMAMASINIVSRELGEAEGVDATPAAVQKWTMGKSRPTEDKHEAIAKRLGVSPIWLFNGIGAMDDPDAEARRLAIQQMELLLAKASVPDIESALEYLMRLEKIRKVKELPDS